MSVAHAHDDGAAVGTARAPTKFFKRKQLFVEMDELRGELETEAKNQEHFVSLSISLSPSLPPPSPPLHLLRGRDPHRWNVGLVGICTK